VFLPRADSCVPGTVGTCRVGLPAGLDAVTKTNICSLWFLSFYCLFVYVPIQLYRPNNFDNYLFNFGTVSPYHCNCHSRSLFVLGLIHPIGAHEHISLRYESDIVWTFRSFVVMGIVLWWEDGLLLGSLSPCHCSYVAVTNLHDTVSMGTVYARLVLVQKIKRPYKTSVLTYRPWPLENRMIHSYGNSLWELLEIHKGIMWTVCGIFNAKAGSTGGSEWWMIEQYNVGSAPCVPHCVFTDTQFSTVTATRLDAALRNLQHNYIFLMLLFLCFNMAFSSEEGLTQYWIT
jgi:hypothetical protein